MVDVRYVIQHSRYYNKPLRNLLLQFLGVMPLPYLQLTTYVLLIYGLLRQRQP